MKCYHEKVLKKLKVMILNAEKPPPSHYKSYVIALLG